MLWSCNPVHQHENFQNFLWLAHTGDRKSDRFHHAMAFKKKTVKTDTGCGINPVTG